MKRVIQVVGGILAVALAGVFGALYIAPPDLLRVGTNYSAKTVCSNVFLAGRDADDVLARDVQAPGNPLLRYVSVRVDPKAQTVQAHLFGALAPAVSRFRPGLGCSNTVGSELSDTRLDTPSSLPDAVWPFGNTVDTTQDPDVMAVLANDDLLGEGYRAVVVVKGGRVVAESYADGFDAQTPLLGWSMTKTVTAGLIGTLVQTGKMTLDDTLTGSFPNWAEDDRANITVADMLSMSSGLEWNESYGSVSDVTKMLFIEDDMASYASQGPAETAPDTEFNYSSGTSTMLSRVWQDAVGGDSLAYPGKALFEPLGMTSAIMETDAKDTFVGSSYMYATARDWARFGQFLLQKGVWNGQQILPEGFTDWMFDPVPVSDDLYTNGHLWREAPGGLPPFKDAVWLLGHDGQSIGVFPSDDMVVVRLGLTPSRLGYSALPLAQALIETMSE